MSQTKAHPDHKKNAEKDDAAAMLKSEAAQAAASANSIPNPDGSTHAHSHAAHLDAGEKPETKPAAMLREDRDPTTLREPPHLVNRAGKEHKRQ